jgi:hypothetical protein
VECTLKRYDNTPHAFFALPLPHGMEALADASAALKQAFLAGPCLKV